MKIPRTSEFETDDWAIPLGVLSAVSGAAISGYSIAHHWALKVQGQTDAFCNINETLNCDLVAGSRFAEVFGIPLGVWGLGYFIATVCCLLLGARKWRYSAPHRLAYQFLVGIGVLASLALALVSAISIGAYCLSCMGVYGATFLQGFVLLVFRRRLTSAFSLLGLVGGGATASAIVGITIATFWLIVPSAKNVEHRLEHRYVSGWHGARKVRQEMVSVKSYQEARDIVLRFGDELRAAGVTMRTQAGGEDRSGRFRGQ